MKKSNHYLTMNSWIRCCVILLLISPTAFAEQQFLLTEAEWSRPRSASVVKSYPAVQQLMQAWLRSPESQYIELRYPGGEEGSLWAQEIKDWLIATGVPSQKLQVYPGHPRQAEIALVVLP